MIFGAFQLYNYRKYSVLERRPSPRHLHIYFSISPPRSLGEWGKGAKMIYSFFIIGEIS